MILSDFGCARAGRGASPAAPSPAPSAAAPAVWMKRRREIVLFAMSRPPPVGAGDAATDEAAPDREVRTGGGARSGARRANPSGR
ncbi:hypothetical protein AMYX_04790 [Anaeromyxobacter diazotrophicus]|uniref:Uncharacterized protein n=1 Tax=Anaeromyxobacter diazotrophicus TaxID=2590199 RepID=A0A7I9VHY9_9BACT|nr:hypothetical protein AMYX_04790 [Anaeromyxobacter diazotrophicus]